MRKANELRRRSQMTYKYKTGFSNHLPPRMSHNSRPQVSKSIYYHL